jgi:hypothetical protein
MLSILRIGNNLRQFWTLLARTSWLLGWSHLRGLRGVGAPGRMLDDPIRHLACGHTKRLSFPAVCPKPPRRTGCSRCVSAITRLRVCWIFLPVTKLSSNRTLRDFGRIKIHSFGQQIQDEFPRRRFKRWRGSSAQWRRRRVRAASRRAVRRAGSTRWRSRSVP